MQPEFSPEYFGRNLFIIRKICKLSQKEMAKLLGIGVGTLRKLESGILPPRVTVSVLERIYGNFGIMPNQILTQNLFP